MECVQEICPNPAFLTARHDEEALNMDMPAAKGCRSDANYLPFDPGDPDLPGIFLVQCLQASQCGPGPSRLVEARQAGEGMHTTDHCRVTGRVDAAGLSEVARGGDAHLLDRTRSRAAVVQVLAAPPAPDRLARTTVR